MKFLPIQSSRKLPRASAKKMADTYYELLSADVETDFPSNLNDLSLQLEYNKGEAAGNNFMESSTKVDGAAAKKHRKSKK